MSLWGLGRSSNQPAGPKPGSAAATLTADLNIVGTEASKRRLAPLKEVVERAHGVIAALGDKPASSAAGSMEHVWYAFAMGAKAFVGTPNLVATCCQALGRAAALGFVPVAQVPMAAQMLGDIVVAPNTESQTTNDLNVETRALQAVSQLASAAEKHPTLLQEPLSVLHHLLAKSRHGSVRNAAGAAAAQIGGTVLLRLVLQPPDDQEGADEVQNYTATTHYFCDCCRLATGRSLDWLLGYAFVSKTDVAAASVALDILNAFFATIITKMAEGSVTPRALEELRGLVASELQGLIEHAPTRPTAATIASAAALVSKSSAGGSIITGRFSATSDIAISTGGATSASDGSPDAEHSKGHARSPAVAGTGAASPSSTSSSFASAPPSADVVAAATTAIIDFFVAFHRMLVTLATKLTTLCGSSGVARVVALHADVIMHGRASSAAASGDAPERRPATVDDDDDDVPPPTSSVATASPRSGSQTEAVHVPDDDAANAVGSLVTIWRRAFASPDAIAVLAEAELASDPELRGLAMAGAGVPGDPFALSGRGVNPVSAAGPAGGGGDEDADVSLQHLRMQSELSDGTMSPALDGGGSGRRRRQSQRLNAFARLWEQTALVRLLQAPAVVLEAALLERQRHQLAKVELAATDSLAPSPPTSPIAHVVRRDGPPRVVWSDVFVGCLLDYSTLLTQSTARWLETLRQRRERAEASQSTSPGASSPSATAAAATATAAAMSALPVKVLAAVGTHTFLGCWPPLYSSTSLALSLLDSDDVLHTTLKALQHMVQCACIAGVPDARDAVLRLLSDTSQRCTSQIKNLLGEINSGGGVAEGGAAAPAGSPQRPSATSGSAASSPSAPTAPASTSAPGSAAASGRPRGDGAAAASAAPSAATQRAQKKQHAATAAMLRQLPIANTIVSIGSGMANDLEYGWSVVVEALIDAHENMNEATASACNVPTTDLEPVRFAIDHVFREASSRFTDATVAVVAACLAASGADMEEIAAVSRNGSFAGPMSPGGPASPALFALDPPSTGSMGLLSGPRSRSNSQRFRDPVAVPAAIQIASSGDDEEGADDSILSIAPSSPIAALDRLALSGGSAPGSPMGSFIRQPQRFGDPSSPGALAAAAAAAAVVAGGGTVGAARPQVRLCRSAGQVTFVCRCFASMLRAATDSVSTAALTPEAGAIAQRVFNCLWPGIRDFTRLACGSEDLPPSSIGAVFELMSECMAIPTKLVASRHHLLEAAARRSTSRDGGHATADAAALNLAPEYAGALVEAVTSLLLECYQRTDSSFSTNTNCTVGSAKGIMLKEAVKAVQTQCDVIQSTTAWRDLFRLAELTATSGTPAEVLQGYRIPELARSNAGSQLSEPSTAAAFVACVSRFVVQRAAADRISLNLSAVQLLWSFADVLASAQPSAATAELSTAAAKLPRASTNLATSATGASTGIDSAWSTLVLKLKEGAADRRLEVRHSCIKTLFSLLVSHADHVPPPTWRTVAWDVLIPLMSDYVLNAPTIDQASSSSGSPGGSKATAASSANDTAAGAGGGVNQEDGGAPALPPVTPKQLDEVSQSVVEGTSRVLRVAHLAIAAAVSDATEIVDSVLTKCYACLDGTRSELVVGAAAKAVVGVAADLIAYPDMTSSRAIEHAFQCYERTLETATSAPPAGPRVTLSCVKIVVDGVVDTLFAGRRRPPGSGWTASLESAYLYRTLALVGKAAYAHSVENTYMHPSTVHTSILAAIARIGSEWHAPLEGGLGASGSRGAVSGTATPPASDVTADALWSSLLELVIDHLPTRNEAAAAVEADNARSLPKAKHPHYVAAVLNFAATKLLGAPDSTGSPAGQPKGHDAVGGLLPRSGQVRDGDATLLAAAVRCAAIGFIGQPSAEDDDGTANGGYGDSSEGRVADAAMRCAVAAWERLASDATPVPALVTAVAWLARDLEGTLRFVEGRQRDSLVARRLIADVASPVVRYLVAVLSSNSTGGLATKLEESLQALLRSLLPVSALPPSVAPLATAAACDLLFGVAKLGAAGNASAAVGLRAAEAALVSRSIVILSNYAEEDADDASDGPGKGRKERQALLRGPLLQTLAWITTTADTTPAAVGVARVNAVSPHLVALVGQGGDDEVQGQLRAALTATMRLYSASVDPALSSQ